MGIVKIRANIKNSHSIVIQLSFDCHSVVIQQPFSSSLQLMTREAQMTVLPSDTQRANDERNSNDNKNL
jgi:hypothetical protein